MRRGARRVAGLAGAAARGQLAGTLAGQRRRGRRPDVDQTWYDATVPSLASRPAGMLHTDLLTAMRVMLTGQVLSPGYAWLLRYRPSVLLDEARDRLDSAGFARLWAHCDATGRRNPQDRKEALNRITWILLNKGGLIGDITVGDCIEISNALQEHQCQGANNRPLFYALLAETGVLPAGAPPVLKATRMAGQRTPPNSSASTACKARRCGSCSLPTWLSGLPNSTTPPWRAWPTRLCGLFWRDLEQHHPGISSLRLDTRSRRGLEGAAPAGPGPRRAADRRRGPPPAASC